MDQFLTNLLVAVVAAAVPVVASFACRFIGELTRKTTEDISNAALKSHLSEVSGAVVKAVANTSQTYVDSLKNAGAFNKEAQKEALARSLNTVLGIITPAALKFIEDTYGDAKTYIEPLIEAEVRKQKKEQAVNVTPLLESVSTDTAAIAASTATATAATIAQAAIQNQPDAAEKQE